MAGGWGVEYYFGCKLLQNDNSKYCLVKTGELYIVFLRDGGTTEPIQYLVGPRVAAAQLKRQNL
jgi:hypothetical protein